MFEPISPHQPYVDDGRGERRDKKYKGKGSKVATIEL